MKFLRTLLLVAPRCVLALPLSYHHSTVTSKTHIPLIVIAISMFFVFVTIKLVYMKHRRIGTIHTPPIHAGSGDLSSSTSSFGLRDKQTSGLFVGCLGSPSWETAVTSRLDRAWRRERRWRSSIVYQWHTSSTMRSTCSSAPAKSKNASSSSRLTESTVVASCSIDADQFMLPLPSAHSRINTVDNGGSSRSPGSVRRQTCHPRCGDFGDFSGARRASPSSIRLVDGPSHSNQVKYSFLSGLPPDAIVVSPLMSARDSILLSRCSLKCDRKAVPPLPPLPSFLPFYLPKDCDALESYCPKGNGYLPPLRFSPLVGATKVFPSRQQTRERNVSSGQTPDPVESPSSPCAAPRLTSYNTGSLTSSFVVQDTPPLHLIRKTSPKTTHKRSRSYKGLAIEGLSSQATLVADEAAVSLRAKESKQAGVLRTPSGTSHSSSVSSKKALKSCLQRSTICSFEVTLTPISEATQTCIHPISDVDFGTLKLGLSLE